MNYLSSNLFIYKNYSYINALVKIDDSEDLYSLPDNINIDSLIINSNITHEKFDIIENNKNVLVYARNKIYEGILLEYNNDIVKIDTGKDHITIRNYESIEAPHPQRQIKFSSPGDKSIIYKNDYISYDNSYIIYVNDNNVTYLNQIIKVKSTRDENKVYDNIFLVMGVNETEMNTRHESFMIRLVSNTDFGYNENTDFDLIRVPSPDKIQLRKNKSINFNGKYQISGTKIYSIDSNYVQGPINYGYIIIPSINIYPGKLIIIDERTNIVTGRTDINKVRKQTRKNIIIGNTTSIIPHIVKKVSESVVNDTIITNYNFEVTYRNYNNTVSNIRFEHYIEFNNYEILQGPQYMEGNTAIWENKIAPQSGVKINYKLIISRLKE